MNQEKSSNNSPGGGDHKALVNVKDALCSFMMGDPTEEWGKTPSPSLMLCKTSTQEIPQIEPINNSMNKGNTIITHVGNTILDDTSKAGIDENWCLLDNKST